MNDKKHPGITDEQIEALLVAIGKDAASDGFLFEITGTLGARIRAFRGRADLAPFAARFDVTVTELAALERSPIAFGTRDEHMATTAATALHLRPLKVLRILRAIRASEPSPQHADATLLAARLLPTDDDG